MTEKQLDELFPEMTLNKNSRARKKCLVVYLRKKGYQREEVAELLRIDEDTVTNYTKKYDESGMVWCFVRLLLPSASGRKRHNVLGAYDPITHEAITVTDDTYINQDVFCEFLEKIAKAYADSGRPITLILDNARYQKCQSVASKAKELNIELLYLPPYSPNLNLIERLWRFVKKQVLYSKHYDRFDTFRNSINNCISDLGTRFKNEMQSLMTMKFQLF